MLICFNFWCLLGAWKRHQPVSVELVHSGSLLGPSPANSPSNSHHLLREQSFGLPPLPVIKVGILQQSLLVNVKILCGPFGIDSPGLTTVSSVNSFVTWFSLLYPPCASSVTQWCLILKIKEGIYLLTFNCNLQLFLLIRSSHTAIYTTPRLNDF